MYVAQLVSIAIGSRKFPSVVHSGGRMILDTGSEITSLRKDLYDIIFHTVSSSNIINVLAFVRYWSEQIPSLQNLTARI